MLHMKLVGNPLIGLRLLPTSITSNSIFSNRRFLSCSSCLNARETPTKSKDRKHAYSDTLNLPRTPFPLKADAAKREILFRKRTTEELYDWQVSEPVNVQR